MSADGEGLVSHARAAPDLSEELYLDFDATIVVAHSEKQWAAPTWKKTFGFPITEDIRRAVGEIANLRYRITHTAARIVRTGRVVYMRLDRTWGWAKQLALGFGRLRAALA